MTTTELLAALTPDERHVLRGYALEQRRALDVSSDPVERTLREALDKLAHYLRRP